MREILLGLPWIAPFFSLFRLAGRKPDIADATPSRGRRVSVIIPARNECRSIATVVRSILASSYTPFELIVVDDRSTDDTAAISAAIAREDPRLRVLAGAELPDGWFGKPWACVQGYRAASGDLLLFTDADTYHEPALLGHAVGALEQEGAELVTVAPHQRCVSFWERLVMPQVWLLLGLRYHPRVVNRGRHASDVIANGQFILVTRPSYEQVGTHAAVRDQIAEDLALAQRYHRAGLKLHFAFAHELMTTRMYHGLDDLIEGWSKNVYLGGRQSYPDEPMRRALVPVTLSAALVYWLLPATAVLFGVVALPAVLPGAIFATLAGGAFWMTISHGMEIPVWYGLLYPLGAGMTLYIVLRSTWRGSRRVEWKGRTYWETGKRG